MKYLFVITNHASFLSSVGTMNYLNLPHENVIFYTIRNYKNEIVPVDWKMKAVDKYFEQVRLLTSEKHSEIRKKIAVIDRLVKDDTEGDYSLFIPHLSHPFYRLLATNRCCKQISYVQEGILSYKKVFLTQRSLYSKLRTKAKQLLKYHSFRFWEGIYWYMDGTINHKALHSYAINDRLFQYLPSFNHIIKWPNIELDIQFENDAVFFLFDGFVVNRFVESDYYLRQCKKLIEMYAGKINYVKFHPNETVEERNAILGYFKTIGCESKIASDTIPFELVLSSKKNLKIVGLGTSLLFLAYELGHNVVCHDDWLLDSSMFQRYKKEYEFQMFRELYNIADN